MDLQKVLFIFFVGVLAIVSAQSTGKRRALRCYECNVWKAGFGHLCDNPRIVDECTVCMKMYTFVYMGYYKNTPRMSVIVSKICGNDDTPHFSDECHTYESSDGYNHRCYCDTDLCNGATSRKIPVLLMSSALLVAISKIWTFL